MRALPTVDRDLPTEVWHDDGTDALGLEGSVTLRELYVMFWLLWYVSMICVYWLGVVMACYATLAIYVCYYAYAIYVDGLLKI